MVVPRMPQAAQVQAKRKTIPAMRLVTAPSPFGPPSLARRCFNVKYFVSQSYGGGAPAGRAGFSPSTRQPINQQSRRTPAPLGRYRGATHLLPPNQKPKKAGDPRRRWGATVEPPICYRQATVETRNSKSKTPSRRRGTSFECRVSSAEFRVSQESRWPALRAEPEGDAPELNCHHARHGGTG